MRSFSIFLFGTVIAITIYGCGPREVIKETDDERLTEALHEYEREFDPSQYNAPFQLREVETERSEIERDRLPILDPENTTIPEFIQGFRIQLFLSSDMETVQEVVHIADSLFTDHWTYIVYEAPFYKVRLGDFQSRMMANRALSRIIDVGFRDAWIVPDRVVKDPPEKIIEPEYKETEKEESENQRSKNQSEPY
jgi:hypothetical protein